MAAMAIQRKRLVVAIPMKRLAVILFSRMRSSTPNLSSVWERMSTWLVARVAMAGMLAEVVTVIAAISEMLIGTSVGRILISSKSLRLVAA